MMPTCLLLQLATFHQSGGTTLSPINMQFSCNRFAIGNRSYAGINYGLYVADDGVVDDIGGDNSTGNNPPVANVFPTDGTRPTMDKFTTNGQDGWDVPNDYVAVRLPDNAISNFYHFGNCFVGEVEPANAAVRVASMDCYTAANAPDTPAPNQIEVCSDLPTGVIYFPLRQGSNVTRQRLGASNLIKIYPLPFSDEVNIVGWSASESSIMLQNTLGISFAVSCLSDEASTRLKTIDLAPGLYYLKINGVTFKLIKQ